MDINPPSRGFGFFQERTQVHNRMENQIRGDADPTYAGNYTVGGGPIVDEYNKSTHWRSSDELNRMGEINEAYHKKNKMKLTELIADTKKKFQDHASHKVASMWSDVFQAYSK